MIKLLNANYTKYGSVQVKDIDLEIFAYKQLRDYKKNYFKDQHPLDIDDFVEFYLKKDVKYYQLSTKDSDKRPLGTTAITDGKVAIINDEGIPEIKIFNKGTIIIDEDACGSETRRRFTLGHEVWHSQFDLHLNSDLIDNGTTISDTYLIIGNSFRKVKTRTPKEWIEYHADIYAVFLLMPKPFINKLFDKYHKEYFGKERRLTSKRPKRTWLMIASMAEQLNVSKTALAYRLREMNKISEEVFVSLKINQKKEEMEMV